MAAGTHTISPPMIFLHETYDAEILESITWATIFVSIP